ncbi:hypothetical protein BCR41DRAFT_396637 [Lobosporangium transversale]|uniref:Uncharacterized protein n=1 Tax=Lobosporangium transversale TaxID=64571 RepID=A0A1Y2GLR6_9FUNG|nr:hypothetical protein BCR41DRAFT_396637 [Lobosporangium transversale]ORZ14914.1 hypothetical protein BCR41DRAFT_396637 [Lobosporangium transversale]|eukprot:XP_021881046.1 hypothetical protein BCR41DRAFT_396637 [Lobosporangium transversale]
MTNGNFARLDHATSTTTITATSFPDILFHSIAIKVLILKPVQHHASSSPGLSNTDTLALDSGETTPSRLSIVSPDSSTCRYTPRFILWRHGIMNVPSTNHFHWHENVLGWDKFLQSFLKYLNQGSYPSQSQNFQSSASFESNISIESVRNTSPAKAIKDSKKPLIKPFIKFRE